MIFFFFRQKTAYELRIGDWSSDVCSSDLQTYGWLSAVIGPFMLGWLSLRLIDVVSGRVLDRFGHRSRATATSIVRFAGRLAKEIGRASWKERVRQYV